MLLLPHGGRGFSVSVDPSALPAGLHFAKVQAFAVDDFDEAATTSGSSKEIAKGRKNRLFILLSSDSSSSSSSSSSNDYSSSSSSSSYCCYYYCCEVLKLINDLSIDAMYPHRCRIDLSPGGIHRRFYTPPAGCTWADVQVVDKREADAAAADSAAHLLV